MMDPAVRRSTMTAFYTNEVSNHTDVQPDLFEFWAARLLQMQQITARVNFCHCSLHVNGKLPRAGASPQLLHPPTALPPPSPLVTHPTSLTRASEAEQTARLPPLHLRSLGTPTRPDVM